MTRFSLKFATAVAMGLAAFAAASASAVPLAMTYSMRTITDDTYQYRYDFTVTLTNADNSWVPGGEWDGFVFGDRHSGDPTVFAIHSGKVVDLTDPHASGATYTGGAHQGPTIMFGDYPSLPDGWKPTAVGQSFSWGYLSNTAIAPETPLLWSTTSATYSSNKVNFSVAQVVPVPEPGEWAMMAAGLGIVGGIARRRSQPSGALA